MVKLAVVVPCYNEVKNIPLIIKRFNTALASRSRPQDFEILLVNNGSTDGSAEVMEAELAKLPDSVMRVVHVPVNRGYGYGIVSGLKLAKADVLSWTHADMQTDPLDVFKAFDLYQDSQGQQGDLIVKGVRTGRGLSSWGFSLGMALISSFLLRMKFYEINAQPKVFSRRFFESLQSPPDDFSLDLFLLYMAKKRGIPIKTLPVLFPDRIHGESKWATTFSSKIKTIRRTIDYILKLRQQFKEPA